LHGLRVPFGYWEAKDDQSEEIATEVRTFLSIRTETTRLAAGSRDSLRLACPAALASRWMPGLFPEAG
jgi:hypothetical protein